MSLSSRVAVMNHGEIEQVGPPDEVYERPATRFVEGFVGRTIRLRGMIEGDAGQPRVRIGTGTIVAAIEGPPGPGRAVEVTMRPEDVTLQPSSAPGGNCLAGQIVAVTYYGDRLEYAIRIDGEEEQVVTVDADKRQRAAPGDRVYLGLDTARVKLWPL
jgi:ABC-type Fe3+/spermidine/putrescine transport system ATPase subunit